MEEKKIKFIFYPNNTACKLIPPKYEALGNRIVKSILEDTYIKNTLNIKLERELLEPQKLGEEEFDGRIEYPIRVTDIQGNIQFLRLFTFLLNYLENECKPAEFSMSIVLETKNFFTVPFCAANENMAALKVSYVNLRDRVRPIVHQALDIKSDPRNVLSQLYGHQIRSPMVVDFEHDRRQVVVRFPYTEHQVRSEQQGNGNFKQQTEIVDYCVSLIVRYKTIKRIMACLRETTNNGRNNTMLEIYLHLSAPTMIRRLPMDQIRSNDNGKNRNTRHQVMRQGDRFVYWDTRSRAREAKLGEETNESPYFRILISSDNINDYCQLLNRLGCCTERLIEFRPFVHDVCIPFAKYITSPLDDRFCIDICHGEYELLYMISALLSRGAVVKDYILLTVEARNEFLIRCAQDYFDIDSKSKMIVLEVLEKVLSEIDERLDSQSPMQIYIRNFELMKKNSDALKEIQDDHANEGYVRVRKIVITPTRILFVAPELLMGNRVLRMDANNYPLDSFLRVIFRDDDGQSVHANNVGFKLIDRFIYDRLIKGIKIAGRSFNYFGSSNSQLRDNGCYFIRATLDEITLFRQQLGSFKIQSAPKMMSRLGQCFTQARETSIELDRCDYATQHDFENGRNRKGEPYNFSDGVGRISLRTARELSSELNLEECVPSCYQIRFRGYKGVISVDKQLDKKREWGTINNIPDRTDVEKHDCWLDLKIAFRLSQKKFNTMREKQKLEIVKYSAPVQLSLNRPVINILDQVSQMQSASSHERISSRIHLLMDIHLHSLTRSLMDESRTRIKLGEFPKMILYDQISDLNLTKEPFFRSLVRASVQASLKKLRQKLQIPIPNSLGRAMFGVVDESGTLQYGQVFIQYTRNAGLKLPGLTADRQILTGPVMITKNPSIVAGDIRMFEAVDLPVLRHLCDLVVFPRYGPRPHPDEMAGSDLDGDEYSVVWDNQLFIDHNEPAFDYTCLHEEAKTTDEDQLRAEMSRFFVNYIKQDSIGKIANAFLANSDLFGINSNVCNSIANKHMEAVDFPKTGVPPKSLETKWGDDLDDDDNDDLENDENPSRDKPPERPERCPDFMEKNNEPMYISTRMNGQLFRRAMEIDDILSRVAQEEESAIVQSDPLIYYQGYDDESILKLAEQHYEAYAANIHAIMDSYGIKSEGELFSGHFISLRNRLSDKDSDDMSFFNTTHAIEQRLFAVFAKFRRQFFETASALGKRDGEMRQTYEDVTTPIHRYGAKCSGTKEVFRRVCHEPSENMKILACAYYKISYESKIHRLLSFPWLAWEVLNLIRRTNLMNHQEERYSFDPLSEMISKHMSEYITKRIKSLSQFREKMSNPNANVSSRTECRGWESVKRYCKRYKGLDKLMFFSIKWANFNDLLNDTLTQLHICILLIQFGLNYHPCELIEHNQFTLEQTDPDTVVTNRMRIDLGKQFGGLGKKFMLFMEFLGSRQFETLPQIDFGVPGIGYESLFCEKQWIDLHKIALKTFHQVAFTFRFDTLPATTEQRRREQEKIGKCNADDDMYLNGEPFVIEVPSSHQATLANNQQLRDCLCRRTGCKDILFRPMLIQGGERETVRFFVSSTGPIEALVKLRSLLAVRPNLNLSSNCRQMTNLMAAAVYERLISEN